MRGLIAGAAIFAAFFFAMTSASRSQSIEPYKLTWVVGTITAQGPVTGEAPEAQRFKTEAECLEFARVMTPRMEDWVRGRVNGDWGHPVGVRFRCEIDGKDS